MSPDKFWLKFNNTNKEELKEAKHGIRKDQIAPKYHNLFDGYDTNQDGVLEDKEIKNMYTHLKNFAGDDKTLDEAENLKAKSVFAQKANMPDSDFMGFVKSVSDAATEIISTKEKYTRDGGKEVTTEYKDGTTQTVAYYKNGDFKWKKTNKHIKTTTFEMEINGQKKEISEEEFNKAKNRLQKKGKIGNIKGTEGQTQTLSSGISSDNVKISTNTTERDEHTEEFSPRFIAENLGIDIQTEEGSKILERLSFIPKQALSAIKDGKEVSELLTQNDLEADFNNISNILEIVYGITLRTEEEFEASKQQREQLISQIQTVGIMSELYAAVAQYNDDYTDSQGLFGMGSEGFGWLLNKCGIQGENHYQWANSCREFIKKINNFKVLNPEKFQKEFEELTGKNNFNTEALQKMIALSKDGKAQDEDGNYTEEYKDAVKAFSNFDISNPNAKAWYHPDNLLNGFGEALTMIVTLGWGAETQGGKILAASAMGTFSRLGVNVASRQAKNKLFQGALRLSGRGIKLIGPAINEGTKMYLYTAATGTATNITNRAAKFDSEENSLERLLDTEAAVLDGAVGSFSFGAFAGVFGSTVTQKVMQIASRTSQKVGTALADKFATGAVDATDAYITILEKSMPTKVAEAVAFATDVFGFTAFESALAIYHASNDPKKYPNGISIEDLTTILWDEFKGQGVNLGQIKGVSYLIMWLTGSRSARMQASKYMRDNIPQLKGSTLELTENGYKIKLPNGKTVNCKNETEMISSLHLMVRRETAFSKRFDGTRIDEKEAANIRALLQESILPEESVKTDNKKDETFQKEETDNSIPPEKIQRLFEKANGKQNVINNLQKLIDAECSYGVLSDIVHRLDVPEHIVETYIQKFKETNCDIGYGMFTLINSLQDGRGLRSDYKEVFDYTIELFERTANGKKLNASQVAELMRYGRGDKKDIDLIIEYMNINELKDNPLTPKDIADLIPVIKNGDVNIKTRITQVAKLLPEQLASRNNKPLDGNTIKEILEIENLTDEKLELIKSVLCDKNLQENSTISDYIKITCVKHLDFNEHLIDLFKDLITTDLHPANMFSKKSLSFISVCDIVKNYPDKEDIATIKKLFELKADGKNGKRIQERDFEPSTISREDLAKMREYIEAVKENEDLMNHLSFQIVSNEKRMQSILKKLQENPNLTYDKIVMEVDILPKIKHIENKALYDLALEVEKQGLKTASDLIQEVSYKIDGVEDKYLNDRINTFLKEALDYLKKGKNQCNYILPIIDSWLDVYHTLKGDYEYIGTKDNPTYKRALYEFAKENEPQRAEELNRAIQEGRFESNNEEWSDIMRDFAMEAGIERLRTFLKDYPHDQMGEHLYKQYYLKTVPVELASKCEKIFEKYGTNIFLSLENNPELAKTVLDFIDAELNEWKEKSNGTCVFPPVIDFSKAKRDYIDEESAYGDGTAAAFAEAGATESISIDGYDRTVYTLRHEMTHINDLKKGYETDIQYNIEEIMPRKIDENGKEVIDIKNCKYKEEFLKAGINPKQIKYAYNNIQEFIAVAAEGDMSKYSPEFKKILINFGMPEWVLNMEVTDPAIKSRSETVSYLIESAKQYDITQDGKKVDIEKEPILILDLISDYVKCEQLSELASKEFRRHNVPNDPKKLFEYCFARKDKDEIFNDLSRIKDILLSDNTNKTSEHPTITMPANVTINEEAKNSVKLTDRPLPQASQDNKFTIRSDGNDVIRPLTGKETLETLYKIKAETDKVIEQLIKEHEEYRNGEHTLQEKWDESDKFFEIKRAHEKYQKAVNTAIELAERIAYEETQSKIEKEFPTIDKEKAEATLKEALNKYSSGNDWYSSSLLRECTIEDKVSEELVNRTVEMLKQGISDLSMIRQFIELFTNKNGIDRAAIETYDELSKGEYKDKNKLLTELLEACKDREDYKFRLDYYEKFKQITTDTERSHSWVRNILRSCEKIHVTPDTCHSYFYLDEALWAKAIELKEMGFDAYNISCLIDFCRNASDISTKRMTEFSQERFNLILELKDKYNISLDNISSILRECDHDGEFNKGEYETAIALKGHVRDEDISGYIDILARVENKELAIKHIDELQQKYGVESKRVMFLYKTCCDVVKDADGKEKTYKFNPLKYQKAIELKEKYNVDDFDLQHYIKTCTVKGKFEEAIYNKIVEFKEKYGFEDDIINRIIGECIHPAKGESNWECSIIDYKLLDKIGVWTDLYIKSSDEVSEILQIEKNHDFREIGHNLTNILEKITSVDCEATDYIEKFIEAGMVKIQTRLREVIVRDENGYITEPPRYNTKAMDIMLEWANKYHLEDEQFSSVMYRINTQTKLPKEEAMKCISQLYQAGWEPKNTDSFRAIIEHWGHNGSCEFDLDAINLFTEYLHKGFSASVIEQAIFSCSKNGEPHTDEYYVLNKEKFDRTLEIVRYVPDDYKFEAAGWMHYFSDYSDSMIKILDDHHFKIPFQEFYDFARHDICNVDVMHDPKKLARVPQILEQIAQHPESFNDIKEIWLDRNFPHNDKYYNFCFRHLKDSEWKKCFDAWRNLENGRGFYSDLLIDILDALDNDKMPLMPAMEWKGRIPEPVLSTIQSSRLRNNIKIYAFAICQQIDRYDGDGVNKGQYCPEVIEKVKDLMLKGELSTILLRTVGTTTLVFDNPEFCKVLDALAKAEREGLDATLIQCAFYKIRGGSNVRDNHFAQNYQEIIDFYVRHKDILGEVDTYKAIEDKDKNSQIYNLIYTMQTEDVELLEKTLTYAQKLDNPSVIKTIGELIVRQQNKDSYYNHEIDIKPILDFLDKVDMEKYGKEVNNLLSQMTEGRSFYDFGNYGHMYKLFDKNLSKESIEFILETEKLIEETYLDDGTASKSENGYLTMPTTNRPYLTNDFFNLFLDGKIPDEALNKLQFYLEYQASMINDKNKDDIPFEVVGSGEKHGNSSINLDEIIKFVRLYKLSPDRIEFLEKYLFGTEEETSFINHIVTYLSKDEALLNEELNFLDEVLSYEDAIDSKYRIDEVLRSSTGENFESKMEVWNLIKPKKKKLAKGDLSRKLYMLLGVETFNKDVFLTAYSQNRFDDVALGNLIGHTNTSNKDLILEMLNDKKYTPEFINNIALFINNPTRADIAKQMLKDGTFTEDQMKNILNATTERTEALSRELCFSKEINFPKEHIFDILWTCTDDNEQLAWKLCTSKVRQIPVDKIPLAMRCYKNKNTNMDMYINKFKMFLDLEFSDDFIKSILGTSGSISRYTKNFCTVLQHLQQQGLKAEKCVEILTSDALSDNITLNIDALEILNLIGSEDIKLLQSDGIDIYDKIQKLQKAIDVKHPIIGVQKGNEIGTLKALANNGDADRVIQTIDLTQFEQSGIPLQYTREEFIQNMSRLITEYTSGESDKLRGLTSVERKPIPDLELSKEAQEKVQQIIEKFKEEYKSRTKDEEIILDGKKCHGIRFTGSKTNGSNPGDFYLIDGKLFYVKTPTSDKLGQSVEEVIASRLYRAAGIDAPNEHYIFDEKGGVIGMASEYVPDMQPRRWSSASEAETKLMFESFAVDAWLANWDAPCNDNTQLYDNGKIIKSDVGGTMHYHARGTIKTEFNGTVIELLSLIEHNSFYSKMTKQDVLNSIKRVLDIPDATIYQTIMQSPSRDTRLAETMIRRKAYLQKFYENLENLEEGNQNIVDLIIEAQGKTVTDFKEIPDIAGAFGYIQTENGFEGLLNTQGSEKLQLTPEQKAVADKIKAEIERFTIHNRVADNANVPQEVRDFVNSILQGVPEFAPYFGKPQHGGHQYSLDIHILNVLQKSLNNPRYDAVDKDGFKLLDDESKMVLKFSALLHDIGKMHMSGKDEGHAERSAEYVYSILDRFNLPKRVKNRIINIVNNHHWFEQLCTGAIQENTVATIFRTTADFTIARIMAQSDLESVHDGYFTSRMSRNFPKEVSNEASAYKKFNSMMDNIQAKVTQIEESSAVVTPSKWVEVPEHIGSDGKVVPRRGFPLVDIELDGKIEQFRILNLNDLDPETDMYQYGFSHIKLKDLKLLVHRFGDGEWGKFTTTKILGDNPSRFSVQSLSLINPAHTSAYSGRNFSCIMEGNNANIGVAYYKNAGTGTRKNLRNLEEELFGSHFEKKRNFFKKEFLQFMEKRGIKLNDHQYGIIMRYARNKRYIETQIQDLNLGNVTIKRQDLVEGLLAAQEVLIEKQKNDNYEAHNEETLIDCNVIAGGASLKNIEELKKNPEFLRLCRDNCNGTIILW